jgi:radical SAM superfamily enzyme YgiQ (UPF0313 family)
MLAEKGVRNVKLIDEMFALGAHRVKEVCNTIADLGHEFNIWAYARISTINDDQLVTMRKAGIKWLAYGIESGDDHVLQNVDKHLTADLTRRVVEMTRDHGISVCGNYIFGLPGEDADSMKKTLDLAIELNAEWANFYSVIPYPGSRLYTEAVEKKLSLPKTWSGYSQYSADCCPLPTEKLSSQEILAFRDEAFRTYYTNESYLTHLRKTFGDKAVKHVKQMMLHEMRRT